MGYETWASSPAARAAMKANKNKDTRPELAVRSALHREGLRFRVHYPVPEMPRRSIDVAFPRKKIAVFIDGCYWHGCRAHRSVPATNREFWTKKLALNRVRDSETDTHLRNLGWTPLRFWEHDSVNVVVIAVRAHVCGSPSALTRHPPAG